MPRKKHSFDFMDYDCDFDLRVLYLGSQKGNIDGDESGVDAALSERAIKALYMMDKQDPNGDKPVSIILNNPGGDILHCKAIYDAIRAMKSHVTITVFGMAMSAGSLILQAADHRIISPSSTIMIHYGTTGTYDHSKNFYKVAEVSKKHDKWMEDIYLSKIQEKKPEYKMASLKKLLDFDTYLDAQEALELGLVDAILGRENEKS